MTAAQAEGRTDGIDDDLDGLVACPNGDGYRDAAANEVCSNDCCFATCPAGVTPYQVSTDCPAIGDYVSITCCCIRPA